MRVAVIHNLPLGGARRRLENQLAHLDSEVVEVTLSSGTPITENARVIPYRRFAPELRPALRPPMRYADFARLLGAWRQVALVVARNRPDVVFANPCQYLQGPPALLFGRPAPSVYFCDEPRRIDYEPAAQATINPTTELVYRPLRAVERAADRAAMSRADRILTNSHFTARAISAAYRRDATPIPLGVATSFRPIESLAPVRAYVLSVGMLIPTKGHELVIEAAGRAATPLDVVLVAPRHGEPEIARLRRIAAASGVSIDIRIGITDAELRALYSDAYATAYMAQAEPLGLASMEAQACGSPVIVADQGGLPETIDDGVTGISVARTADALAAGLNELADTDRRRGMALAARARGASLRWETSATAIEDALRQAVADGTEPETRYR